MDKMRSFDALFVASLNKLLGKQLNWRKFKTPWHSCDVTVMSENAIGCPKLIELSWVEFIIAYCYLGGDLIVLMQAPNVHVPVLKQTILYKIVNKTGGKSRNLVGQHDYIYPSFAQMLENKARFQLRWEILR